MYKNIPLGSGARQGAMITAFPPQIAGKLHKECKNQKNKFKD